jgi:hypothetical protein
MPKGPRVFTPEEADALLPRVEEIFRDLDRIRDRMRLVKRKLDVLEMIYGGNPDAVAGPDRTEYRQCLEAVEEGRREFEALVARLNELGGTLKGLDEGLVDFYGVVEGHLVWLCWKRGEPEVSYYHDLDEGFAGRKPLPRARST